MKQLFIFMLLMFGTLSYSQTGPGAMLPDADNLPGWRPSGELKIFSPESISLMAGEDAGLIKEYGLNYAVSRTYYNISGKTINVKVFTMENTFGSYGLFLLKSKGEKVYQEFGNSSFTRPGDFCFWKQYYFIEMHSDFRGDTISEGFRQLAGYIDSKIKAKGLFPQIMGFSKDKPGTVTIFKGPLALSGIYYFSPMNIFKIREGIAIENGGTWEIILKYEDNNEAVRIFSDAAGLLGAMTKFKDFILVGDFSFAMRDKDGKTLVFKVEDNCLNISIK